MDLKAWSETRNNRDGTKHYIHTRVSSEGVLTESQVQALDTVRPAVSFIPRSMNLIISRAWRGCGYV